MACSWGGLFIRVHGPWYAYLRRHPAAELPNAQGIPEPPEAVHWDHDMPVRQASLSPTTMDPSVSPGSPSPDQLDGR